MKILTCLLLLVQPFLLMQPIQTAFETGDFSQFQDICKEKISVNLEDPFLINGYFYTGRFVRVFSTAFSRYEVNKIEWSSKWIERDFAVQSLNLVLKNKQSERIVYYKFIFFMTRDTEWKLYYLKGLRL